MFYAHEIFSTFSFSIIRTSSEGEMSRLVFRDLWRTRPMILSSVPPSPWDYWKYRKCPLFLSDAHTWANCSFIPSQCSKPILTWRRSVDFHFPDDRHLSQFSSPHFYHMNLALLFCAFSSSNSSLASKYLLSPAGNNFILYQKPRLIISLPLPPSLQPFCFSITLFHFYPPRTLRSRQTLS